MCGPRSASAIGYSAGIWVHWLVSSRLVFADGAAARGTGERHRQKMLFVGSALVGLAVTTAIVGTGTALGLDPLATVGLPATYKEYAVFGNATWKIREKFHLTGGLRWARNDQTFTQSTSIPLLGLDASGALADTDLRSRITQNKMNMQCLGLTISRTAAEAKAIKELIGASSAMVQQGSVLADQAGTTMQEVVSSIQRVADMVSEISAASSEQTAGVGQVGEAVTQLDQTTQQNAALVEEMAAAASSLQTQAHQMVSAIAQFNLGGTSASPGLPTRARGGSRNPAISG